MNARSKLTAQNQISVPADVRKRLGVGPGATLEWVEDGGNIIVRRAGGATWEDVHKAAFPQGPPKGPPLDPKGVKESIRTYIQRRHARD